MMSAVKKIVQFSVLLLFFISAVSMLMQQFDAYQRAYQALSFLITHPSITVSIEEKTEENSEQGNGGIN